MLSLKCTVFFILRYNNFGMSSADLRSPLFVLHEYYKFDGSIYVQVIRYQKNVFHIFSLLVFQNSHHSVNRTWSKRKPVLEIFRCFT